MAVPPAVVTATSFKPAALAGVLAVIEVALDTTTFVADTPPTFTLVAPVKFVPTMVMVVAPKVEPLDGVTLEIVGAGTTYVNEIACVVDPLGVVTTIVLAPIVVDAGVTAVIEVALTTTTLVAATPLIFKLLAPVKFVPVMVIAVPPKVDPFCGLTLEIVGAGATYVNALALLTAPACVVTSTVLAPTVVDAAVTAVIEVALTTAKLSTATPPTFTLLAPVKFVPVMVMAVPPSVEPVAGLTLEMVAGATYKNALADVAVPPAFVTAIALAPAAPAGVMAVIEVALITTTLFAATPPTVTLVTPSKFVPTIVNAVPPNVEPEVGLTEVIVGVVTKVKALDLVTVPARFVSATLAAPTSPLGVTAVI